MKTKRFWFNLYFHTFLSDKNVFVFVFFFVFQTDLIISCQSAPLWFCAYTTFLVYDTC